MSWNACTSNVFYCFLAHQTNYNAVMSLLIPQVERLPKTISQKILRNLMVAIVNKKEYKAAPTIDDVTVVAEIELAVQGWRK